MKRMISLSSIALCIFWLVPVVYAADIENGELKFTVADALDHLDFYTSFGNEGKEIDGENMTITLKHKDESGLKHFKQFRLKVVEPEESDNVLEFHLMKESYPTLEDQFLNDYKLNDSSHEIDYKHAYKNLFYLMIPDKYPHAEIKGSLHSITNEGGMIRLTKNAQGFITKFEFMLIADTPDRIKVSIETHVPDKPFKVDYNHETKLNTHLRNKMDTEMNSTLDSETLDPFLKWLKGSKGGICAWSIQEFFSSDVALSGHVTMSFGGLVQTTLSGAVTDIFVTSGSLANFWINTDYGGDGEHIVELVMANRIWYDGPDTAGLVEFGSDARRTRKIPRNRWFFFRDQVSVDTSVFECSLGEGTYYNNVMLAVEIEDTDEDNWIEYVGEYLERIPVGLGRLGREVWREMIETATSQFGGAYILTQGLWSLDEFGCQVSHAGHLIPYTHIEDPYVILDD